MRTGNLWSESRPIYVGGEHPPYRVLNCGDTETSLAAVPYQFLSSEENLGIRQAWTWGIMQG